MSGSPPLPTWDFVTGLAPRFLFPVTTHSRRGGGGWVEHMLVRNPTSSHLRMTPYMSFISQVPSPKSSKPSPSGFPFAFPRFLGHDYQRAKGTIFSELLVLLLFALPAAHPNLRRINVRRSPWAICTFGRLPYHLIRTRTDRRCSALTGPKPPGPTNCGSRSHLDCHSLVGFAGTADSELN